MCWCAFHRACHCIPLGVRLNSHNEYLITVQFFAPSVEAWIERKLALGWLAYASSAPAHKELYPFPIPHYPGARFAEVPIALEEPTVNWEDDVPANVAGWEVAWEEGVPVYWADPSETTGDA